MTCTTMNPQIADSYVFFAPLNAAEMSSETSHGAALDDYRKVLVS
jgi:hypothetical protein